MKKRTLLILNLILLLALKPVSAQKSEYELKAHFLGKFTHYVDWPGSNSADDTARAFIIGIIGDDPFNRQLEEIYQSVNLKGRPTEIRYFDRIDGDSRCDLLFIPATEKNRLKKILKAAVQNPILTVSDSPGFAEAGVLINLYVENNKIGFEINLDAVNKSGLAFDYRLLKLARIIRTRQDN